MTARTPLVPGQAQQPAAYTPVPAARALSDFAYESVGDNVVLYDPDLNRYHTVNSVAFEIWRLCDGTRSIDAISAVIDAPSQVVENAIDLLGESGLLTAPERLFESTMSRRRVVRLAAAGAIGALGIPVVASITRVGPEASASGGCDSRCIPDRDNCCCCHKNNPNCDCSNRQSCEDNQQKFCVN